MKNSHKQKRLSRAQSLQEQLAQAHDEQEARAIMARAARQGVGVALADRAVLAAHSNATFLPGYYIDRPFTCTRCGTQEVWTAKQQKWWYEVAHGPIYSGAHHCRACRAQRRQQRTQTKAASALDQQMAQLRALGQQRFAPHLLQAGPWPDALRSKWWGVRVAAIQTLGQWWGASRAPEALAALRQLAENDSADFKSWPHLAARTARQAMAAHLQDTDMDWALPWLLHGQGLSEVWTLVQAMPATAVLHALASPARLHAAHADAAQAQPQLRVLAAVNENTPGCAPAWARLARHYMASPVVGKAASQWLRWRLERLECLQTPPAAAPARKKRQSG